MKSIVSKYALAAKQVRLKELVQFCVIKMANIDTNTLFRKGQILLCLLVVFFNRQSTFIPMGTHGAPLLADLFVCWYMTDFNQGLSRKMKRN